MGVVSLDIPHEDEDLHPGAKLSNAERRQVWNFAPTEADSAKQFGELHDVHWWGLPFSVTATDTFKLQREIGEFLGGRPPWCRQVARNSVFDHIETDSIVGGHPDLFENLMFVHGWWLGDRNSLGQQYCNPNYAHRHDDGMLYLDRGERREFLARAANYGILDPYQIAPAFGFQAKDDRSAGQCVTSTCSQLEFPWKDRRDKGRERTARTWATLNRWGYSHRAISEAFGVGRNTVSRWIRGVDGDFEPPGDPTEEVIEIARSR